MFQIIKGIDIGQGSGNAFGGGIYSASCSIGYSNNPTKISLNIVSENGKYNTTDLDVSKNSYNINLNGTIFSGMYLYSTDRQKSNNAYILTANFVDSSITLDKTWVGLLNRHGNKKVVTNPITGFFSVRCPSCTDGYLTGMSGAVLRAVDSVPNGCYFEKFDNGGYIILGKENFADSNCEIPKVDYNFTELCNAISSYGIKHELSQFDINPLYRQEYVGSLREILNNWASDFSFEFYFEGNTLKGIDLRQPININSAIDAAENNQYIRNYSLTNTLENSYAQNVVARYLKSSRVVEYNDTFNFKRQASQITLSDILPNGTHAGRNGEVLLTSIALSRLDGALREAYLANAAITYNSVFASLGFQVNSMYKLDSNTIHKLLQFKTTSDLTINSGSYTQVYDENNYDAYIGLYREDIKQAVDSWDSDASNFIGKYYRFNYSLPRNQFYCPITIPNQSFFTSESNWSSLPDSNNYANNSVPFYSLLTDATSNTNFSNYYAFNVFSVEDNVWGIDKDAYNNAKGDYNYDYIKPEILKFSEVPIAQGVTFALLQRGASQYQLPNTIYDNLINKRQEDLGAVIAVILIPKLNKFSSAPKISPMLYRTINNSVYDRVSVRNDSESKAQKCNLYCDIDIVATTCNCGSNYTPVPYFKNLMAPYLFIAHQNGNLSQVVFPVDSDYFGFFTHHRTWKTMYTAIKSIYGTPVTANTNTMGIKVLDYDITPDLDAFRDENNTINQLIYSSTENTIISAQDYYNKLSNLNNLIIPEQKSLKMEVINNNLNFLNFNLSPKNGLTNIDVNLNDGELNTTLSFATRPPSIPKSEAIYTKIKYRFYK